jgi:malate dehydrogenase (oxaloacetate-decarboxylating)
MDKPGYLGKIAHGWVSLVPIEIHIVAQGPDFLVRDITLYLDDEKHLQAVVEGFKTLSNASLEGVIDPVEQAHEGGKIGIKSKAPLTSIAEMGKIYTPGVAQICKLIQKDITTSRTYTCIGNSVAVVTNGTCLVWVILVLLQVCL